MWRSSATQYRIICGWPSHPPPPPLLLDSALTMRSECCDTSGISVARFWGDGKLRELGTRPICPETKTRSSTWIWIRQGKGCQKRLAGGGGCSRSGQSFGPLRRLPGSTGRCLLVPSSSDLGHVAPFDRVLSARCIRRSRASPAGDEEGLPPRRRAPADSRQSRLRKRH